MDWPVSVALAQAVPTLPTGKDLHYEPKLDGSPDALLCLIWLNPQLGTYPRAAPLLTAAKDPRSKFG